MYILYIIVLKIKLITNLHALSVAIHVLSNNVTLLKERNFDLCLQSLAQIVPWMFALYQTRYHQWLSINIRDMMSLLENHQNIRAQLRAEKMVVRKTSSKF